MNAHPNAGHMIWLDLETTGLEEHVNDRDAAILEIALVAVDRQFNEVAFWTTPIRPPIEALNRVKRDPRLCELHSNSGLLGVLDRDAHTMLKPEFGGLPPVMVAEAIALQFMQAYSPGMGVSPIAGANPGFDKTWMRKHMPALLAAFHYRPYDTNFAFLSEHWLLGTPSVKGETRHRALDDCRQSIATARRFLTGRP